MSKDKIIIEALPERFEQLSLFAQEKPKTDKPQKSKLWGIGKMAEGMPDYGIDEARNEFLGYVEKLAELPPPTPQKADDIGFSGATNTPMRNWLYNERQGLNDYASLYRAIEIMNLHRGQLPEGALDRIKKVVEPYAKEESRKYGSKLTGTVRKGKSRHKGKSYDGLTEKEKAEIIIDSDEEIETWIDDVTLTDERITFIPKKTLGVALRNISEATNLPIYRSGRKINNKKVDVFTVFWENFTPDLLEKIKETSYGDGKTLNEKFFPSLDRLWQITAPAKKDIQKREKEISKNLTPHEKTQKQEKLESIIKTFAKSIDIVDDIILTDLGINIKFKRDIGFLLTRMGKLGLPLSNKKFGNNWYTSIKYRDFDGLLNSIKSMNKELTYYNTYSGLNETKTIFLPEQYYTSFDKVWSLIRRILPDRIEKEKKIEKATLELEKYERRQAEEFASRILEDDTLTLNQKISKILEDKKISLIDDISLTDNKYIDVQFSETWLGRELQTRVQYPSGLDMPRPKNISNQWYTRFSREQLPKIIDLYKSSNFQKAQKAGRALEGLLDIVGLIDAKKQQEIEEAEERRQVKRGRLSSEALQKEGKNLLIGLSRYYDKLPKYDNEMYASIVDIAKAIESEPDIDKVIGIALVPYGLTDAEKAWEEENYNKAFPYAPEGQKEIVIPVPKEQASKVIIAIKPAKKGKTESIVYLKLDGRYDDNLKRLRGNYTGEWRIGDKVIIPQKYTLEGKPSFILNDWAIKLEDRYPLLSFALRKWVDTNKDVLGEDCDPKMASLWGKGYFRDIDDPELVSEIQNTIPADFETEGIIPSKELGGKPQRVMFKPYEYQKIGAYYAYKTRRAYIGDTMGLGKTIQALLWLRLLSDDGDAYPSLICAPASVVYNWIDEVERWLPDVSVSAYEDGEKTQIRVMSWGIIADQEARIIKYGYKSLIVDEAHYGKNGYKKPAPARAKAFMNVAQNIDNVVLLSGTPMENRVDELWSQINALKPSAYPKFKDFETAYSPKKSIKLKNGIVIQVQDDDAVKQYKKQKGESLFQKLNREMRCLMIRRLKSDVQETLKLPKKERVFIEADVGKEGRDIYNAQVDNIRNLISQALRKRIVKMISKDVLNGIPLNIAMLNAEEFVKEIDMDTIEQTMIAVFGYLRRATAEAKIPVATQWVKDYIENTKKPLLIWGDHKKVIDSMRVALDDIGISYGVIDGGASKKARNNIVKAFQNGDIDAVILSKAGREGLTLTRASDALFVERWLVPTWEEQAEDRIYRIGQTEDVNIYYLTMSGTTDDKIGEMIEKKRKAIEETVGLEDISDSLGKEAKIEDAIIKQIANDLMIRIKGELEGEPLTKEELIPSREEIIASFTGEEFYQTFLKVIPKVDAEVKLIKKLKSPSRGNIFHVYEELKDGEQESVAKDKYGKIIGILTRSKYIEIITDKMRDIPIESIAMPERYTQLVQLAKANDWILPMGTVKDILSKNQIDKFVEKGLGEIVKKRMEL